MKDSERNLKERFGIRYGKKPETKFIDNMNAVKVRLIDWPDPDRLITVLVNMAKASWYEDFSVDADKGDIEKTVEKLLSGEVLAQGLEHATFCFLVSGLSLHGTHMLVRNRVGIRYMQRSTAVCDFRDEPVLVPRAFTRHPSMLERYKEWARQGKQLYADLLDTGDIAASDARMCLPKSMPQWCYVSCCLTTLLSIYGKRSDTQEEPPEMNIMVEQMKDLVVEKFPYMRKYFVRFCDVGKCLHNRPGYEANSVFARDDRHKVNRIRKVTIVGDGDANELEFYKDNWTLHNKTKQEMMLDADPYDD